MSPPDSITKPEPRRAILVLGMHRSGTSALAGVLSLCGASLPATLLPPADYNPKGFFESGAIVRAHQRLLAELEFSWDDSVPTTRRVGRIAARTAPYSRNGHPDGSGVRLKHPSRPQGSKNLSTRSFLDGGASGALHRLLVCSARAQPPRSRTVS